MDCWLGCHFRFCSTLFYFQLHIDIWVGFITQTVNCFGKCSKGICLENIFLIFLCKKKKQLIILTVFYVYHKSDNKFS